MQKHDHFRELSALATVGQLSAEEQQELSEHLQACESCRSAGDRYEFILDQLPIPEPSASSADLQQLHSKSYRQRFFDRASAEGLRFTRDAVRNKKLVWPAFTLWRPLMFGAAAATVAIVVVSTIMVPKLNRRQAGSPIAIVPTSAPSMDVPVASVNPRMNTSLNDIARLERENRTVEEHLKILRQELAEARADQQSLVAELGKWKDQAGRFQAENEANRQQLGSSRSEAEKLRNDKDQLAASLVEQEFKIKDLSEQVKAQTAAVERERQLTAAAHDVRDMMGARNLHIIDVADLDGHGKSNKSFGRVFYAEGRSLIFYAFDLSEKGAASKVLFQAWGQAPSSGPRVKNLGVFRLDDQAQKRWVLRVDDPVVLGSIESLFVTVEPAPGRDRPTGQKLLYAYLGTPANHP